MLTNRLETAESAAKSGVWMLLRENAHPDSHTESHTPGNRGIWKDSRNSLKLKSAEGRNRTADTRIFSPLLYRLSYLGTREIVF